LAIVAWALVSQCGPPAWAGGIHARLGWSKSGVRVVSLPPEGAAARAGLAVDDRILAIAGKPVRGLSDREVRELLTGEVGSRVVLQVQRGDETLEITVERVPYVRDKPR
jgi:carboxyl-terminal processing protease